MWELVEIVKSEVSRNRQIAHNSLITHFEKVGVQYRVAIAELTNGKWSLWRHGKIISIDPALAEVYYSAVAHFSLTESCEGFPPQDFRDV